MHWSSIVQASLSLQGLLSGEVNCTHVVALPLRTHENV
jgi:hypothetical protein